MQRYFGLLQKRVLHMRTTLCAPDDDVFQEESKLCRFYFFLVFVFYIGYELIMQGKWVLSGEMWAEMGTNFYVNANSVPLAQKFLSTDAGYLPLPQRVLAVLPNWFSFPAYSTPYFYTWAAIFLTAGMVGLFCLPIFRQIVKCDFLRFVSALFVLLMADFESRTFVNFTYFIVFSAAIVTTLAFVSDKKRPLPAWTWLLPFMMYSKPYALILMPAMMLTAFISQVRFRRITLLTLCFSLLQSFQLIISHHHGIMGYEINESLGCFVKGFATAKYFLGLTLGYILGPGLFANVLSLGTYYTLGTSLFILIVLISYLTRSPRNESVLVLMGLTLIFLNSLLNCFTLSRTWNLDLFYMIDLPLDRHAIAGFFGGLLIMTGLISSLHESLLTAGQSRGRWKAAVGPLLFVFWACFSGWFSRGLMMGKVPISPSTGNSYWQIL
jgi:hypothetical protein